MAKEQCMAKVVQTEPLAEDIYSMWLLAPEIAGQAVSGQFISLFCEDGDKLLPRPISLCEIDRDMGSLKHFLLELDFKCSPYLSLVFNT